MSPPSITVSSKVNRLPLAIPTAPTLREAFCYCDLTAFQGAALWRPMVPLIPANLPELKGAPVLVAAGNHDPIIPVEKAHELVTLLRRTGADVTVFFEDAGHGLTEATVTATKTLVEQ